jgi:hypothetical protein
MDRKDGDFNKFVNPWNSSARGVIPLAHFHKRRSVGKIPLAAFLSPILRLFQGELGESLFHRHVNVANCFRRLLVFIYIYSSTTTVITHRSIA